MNWQWTDLVYIHRDVINASFEFAGALLTWMNVRQVWKDKGHAGIFVPAIFVFMSWGFWNLYYYDSLNQWYSVLATWIMVAANVCLFTLLVKFGKKRAE